jgi:hypothetical protein
MLPKAGTQIPLPAELASIVKGASPLPPSSMGAHMHAIEAKKAHETSSFLRAAMMRLQNT